MIGPSILIDTGPLVVLLNKADQHRQRFRDLFAKLGKPLYTCWPVLTEVAHLTPRHDKVRTLIAAADGTFLNVLPITAGDVPRISAVLDRYSDQEFDLADACLMCLAERDSIDSVLTIDSKDFSLFRTTDGRALTILG